MGRDARRHVQIQLRPRGRGRPPGRALSAGPGHAPESSVLPHDRGRARVLLQSIAWSDPETEGRAVELGEFSADRGTSRGVFRHDPLTRTPARRRAAGRYETSIHPASTPRVVQARQSPRGHSSHSRPMRGGTIASIGRGTAKKPQGMSDLADPTQSNVLSRWNVRELVRMTGSKYRLGRAFCPGRGHVRERCRWSGRSGGIAAPGSVSGNPGGDGGPPPLVGCSSRASLLIMPTSATASERATSGTTTSSTGTPLDDRRSGSTTGHSGGQHGRSSRT